MLQCRLRVRLDYFSYQKKLIFGEILDLVLSKVLYLKFVNKK